jgi:hypothetical protein
MATDRPTGTNPAKRIVLIVLLLLLVPVGLALVLFPLLSEQPFDSVDELDPATIKSLNVFLLNRRELDGGEDVGPYTAAPEDYPALLAPLKGATRVDEFPGVRGPLLGEYRVRTTTGRRGTIRLYWVKFPGSEIGLGGAVGSAGLWWAVEAGHAPVARLRFQVGERKFVGGSASEVIRVAEAAAPRGTPGR